MISQAVRQRGWFRTGLLNIILACTCGVALLVCLAISLSKRDLPTGMSSTELFEGSCERVSTLSTLYHIGLNIISTGILSSSNFFMQIVSSPSRKDIDNNHAWLRSLSIGLSSPTNIPVLPWRKQICWAILLVSSVPIHLFFNSAIYSISYQSTSWNVTIATDNFVRNGLENQTYWLPGASLAISGTFSPAQRIRDPGVGYGERIADGYWGAGNHGVRQEIAATARDCASWDVIDAKSCMDEFRPNKYRLKYKNVAIIVSANTTDPRGWKRNEIFGFQAGSDLTTTWDPLVPPDDVNSLWFWAPCSISNDVMRSGIFHHTCSQLFGMNTSHPVLEPNYNVIPLTFAGPRFGIVALRESHQGYFPREGARSLQIDHCLAEKPSTCKLRVSNLLMFITIICVVIKVATCIFLMTTMTTDGSLVTPGDAIESFIRKPDPVTKGISTLSFSEVEDIEHTPRIEYYTIGDPDVFFAMRPRRWLKKTGRLYSSVTRAVWTQVYYPIFLALFALLIGVIMSGNLGGISNFGQAPDYSVLSLFGWRLNYIGTLIVVNLPQLILSFCYLIVNALHTQLQVEHEWNSYARGYAPLRVSYPVGKQVSTYRLQLPYRYSIPLLIISVALHYLVSQSIFLIIAEGGSEGKDVPRPDLASYMGVSPDAAISMSYSGLSMLVFFCASCVFTLSPIVFSFFKLKNDMVMGATNSLVLSAACHITGVPSQPQGNDLNDHLLPVQGFCTHEYLAEVAQGNVRWGAMALPSDLGQKLEANDEPIMHLGFGTEEHDIQTPHTGMLYA